MEIIKSILTKNPCYEAGKKIKVKGLMLHSVGCPQPNAEIFVKNWNNPASSGACVHAFIDGNTGRVYQTLPWDHKGWHCGGNGNSTHVGVEMCEPACIRYSGGAAFSCTDKVAAKAVVKRTYEAAVELFAFLCNQYGLNPLEDGVIISHKEGHDRGLASGHGDPDHLWKGLNCEYSMASFRQDVALMMGKVQPENKKEDVAYSKTVHSEIKVGDVVTLTEDAIYYTGKEIADWIKKDNWIVKSVSGDRAVIDKNTSGKNAICSPVNVKYLKKI